MENKANELFLAVINNGDTYKARCHAAAKSVQDVEFSRNDLELIISSVNNRPQGIAREINPEMFMAILPQVQKIVQDEIKDGWKLNEEKDNYTEAMLILQDMQQASTRNDNMKNMIIEQGKYKILNQ